MKREFSAGGVIYKKSQTNEIFWLITKTAPSSEYPNTYWRLPKGWIDDDEDGKSPGPIARGDKRATEKELEEAALREVREEGGINAKIIRKLSSEKYFFNAKEGRILKFVTFFLMEWVSDIPEGPGFETSEIKWVEYEEAIQSLKYPTEKKLIEKAQKLID